MNGNRLPRSFVGALSCWDTSEESISKAALDALASFEADWAVLRGMLRRIVGVEHTPHILASTLLWTTSVFLPKFMKAQTQDIVGPRPPFGNVSCICSDIFTTFWLDYLRAPISVMTKQPSSGLPGMFVRFQTFVPYDLLGSWLTR